MKYLSFSLVLLSVVILGTMAGFFWTYSINVNQAMLRVDGATYATVQSLFNVTVRNPIFFVFFFGGGVVTFVAVLCSVGQRKTLSFGLLVAACLVYLLGVIVFTHEVNLPLNYYTESWTPTRLPSDWQNIRNDWNQANWTRVFTSFTAFLLALFALTSRKSLEVNR